MSAPKTIDEFIDDIINKLIATGRKLPLHIPAMGKNGGVGCYILSVNKNKKEVEVLYLNQASTSFMIKQRDYNAFVGYFNSLSGYNKKGYPSKYTVANYNTGPWKKKCYGMIYNPLIPSIFKELNY